MRSTAARHCRLSVLVGSRRGSACGSSTAPMPRTAFPPSGHAWSAPGCLPSTTAVSVSRGGASSSPTRSGRPFWFRNEPGPATRPPGPQPSARRLRGRGAAFADADFGHDALEEIVGLGAHHEIAVGDDVGRDTVDPQLLGFGTTLVEVVAEPILFDRRLHSGDVDPGACRDVA